MSHFEKDIESLSDLMVKIEDEFPSAEAHLHEARSKEERTNHRVYLSSLESAFQHLGSARVMLIQAESREKKFQTVRRSRVEIPE